MTNNGEEMLKPCPFCGGEAIECGGNEHNPNKWVMCKSCHACPYGDFPTLDLARSAWNTRAKSGGGEKMSEWKTIDSAPRDGTEILVFIKKLPDNKNSHDKISIAQNIDVFWKIKPTGYIITNYDRITHWMPLPTPPQPEKE